MDVQLHTHRHRSYRKRELFMAELEENRARILAATGHRAEHFCYPSGASLPVFAEWLSACGVRSGTTTEPGLVSRATNPWFLPGSWTPQPRRMRSSRLGSAALPLGCRSGPSSPRIATCSMDEPAFSRPAP